jgi:hypothetical protein
VVELFILAFTSVTVKKWVFVILPHQLTWIHAVVTSYLSGCVHISEITVCDMVVLSGSRPACCPNTNSCYT